MKIIKFFTPASRRIVPHPPSPLIIPSKSFPMLPAPTEEQPQAGSSIAPPLLNKAGQKKRALLIGIQNKPPETLVPNSKMAKTKGKISQKFNLQQAHNNELRGCHKDVRAMKQILIELYGYAESDIIVLMDGDEPGCILPTEENIMQQMNLLVVDAEPGDTFFFHFSGHSTQEPTESKDEEDGMDEFIVTYDDKLIKDDILRETLVNPLPIGSRLITVFDTCHSASLLDLKHTRCNRVWVPWMNKGRRRSDSQRNAVVRKQAVPMSPIYTEGRRLPPWSIPRNGKGAPIAQALQSESGSRNSRNSRNSRTRRPGIIPSDGDPKTPISVGSRDKVLSAVQTDFYWPELYTSGSPIQRCGSPEELFCGGWCEKEGDAHLKFPDVISLSAAKDGQRAWEDSLGSSMTQSLISILRSNPNPTLEELLTHVSHDLHTIYLGLHAKSKAYKKKVRIANLARRAKGLLMKTPAAVEMDNFQNPQISSLYPLKMKEKRWSP